MTPVGRNQKAAIVPGQLQEGKVNYFLGKDPKKWRTDIATYQAVVYREAYPGIDLKFYGTAGNWSTTSSSGPAPITARSSFNTRE